MIQPGQGGEEPPGCTPGTLPSAPAWPAISAFLSANQEETPATDPPSLPSGAVSPHVPFPMKKGQTVCFSVLRPSLFHTLKCDEIEFIDFIRLLVHTPYAFSLLS